MKTIIATLLSIIALSLLAIVGTASASNTTTSRVDRVVKLHTVDPATNPIVVELATDTRFTMRELAPGQFHFRVIYGDGTRQGFTFEGFTYMTVSREK